MKLRKVNEAEEYIFGNPAIPGQPERREGEEDYLSTSLQKRREHIRQQGSGSFDIRTSQRITAGKERELEALATKVINNLYKGLIDRYQIEFDIKFSNTRDIGNMIEVSESIESEKYKRKIINLVTQGEAKNMMNIIHSEDVKEGVYQIFGEEDGNKLIDIWSAIVKAVDKIDIDRDINFWNTSYVKNTIGGAVKVEWTKKEDTNEDKDDDDEFYENEEEENWQENLLNALNTSNDEKIEEIIEERNLPPAYIKGHYKPKIVARGIDFTLLIHEAIKGLYTTLAMGGIPKDKEIAKQVLNKGRSIKEEPEEFKWGPMFAGDLRDFLNENPNIDKYPNLREEFWIYVMKMPTDDFLEFIRGILSKTTEARIKVDATLKIVMKQIKKFLVNREARKKLKEYEEKKRIYGEEMRKYEEDMKIWRERQGQSRNRRTTIIEPEQAIDYSTLSQRELHNLQNDAIDKEDWTTAQKISQYIR